MSEASVRVKRARQILWAMLPKIGSLMRLASQNSRPDFVLINESQPQMAAPARDEKQNEPVSDQVADVHQYLGRSGQFGTKAGIDILENRNDFYEQKGRDAERPRMSRRSDTSGPF